MGNTLIKPQQQQQHQTSETPQLQIPSEIELHQQQHEEEITCEICIEPILQNTQNKNKFKNSNLCSHPFCTDCIIKYIQIKLDQSDAVSSIPCPSPTCPHALEPLACASLVGNPLFIRWCDALCRSSISNSPSCYCPYVNCNALIIDECESGTGEGGVRKCKCPECKGWFCFKCRRIWHAGFGCGETGEMRDVNDVAFGRLVEQRKWMRCPRCRHFVELREGCQIVKCRCSISFCYKCGKQVHKHWCSCDKTSTWCEWCFRICILLVFLTFSLLFLALAAANRKTSRKH